MKTTLLSVLLTGSLLTAFAASAATRTSASYALTTETADAGGRRATSTSYTNDGSAGGTVGISTVAAPAATARHGYIGQLYEVTGLAVTASPTSVNETQTRQLSALQILDDATQLAVSATVVSWSVLSGPIASISAGGLATAGPVCQNTSASVRGIVAGYAGILGLTVLESVADNFGAYAGDGIGDDWQVQYFGQPPNANASPLADPDGDGQTNLFEYTTGVVPTSALSVFSILLDTVPGQPNQYKITFSPRLTDRNYAVQYRLDLASGPDWATLPGATQSDNGQERTVIDLNATETRKFYRVQVTKP